MTSAERAEIAAATRRVHAELTLGRGLLIAHGTVEMLISRAGAARDDRMPQGAPREPRPSTDLVDRRCARDRLDELWVTDITEHPTP